MDERFLQISTLEEQIEAERKTLLTLVKTFRGGGPASEVVAQNLKVLGLIERRSALVRPQKWIEELDGLSLKDIFESKRDLRKIGAPVYMVKSRVEPITSLYVDLALAAELAEPEVKAPALPPVKPKSSAPGVSLAAAAVPSEKSEEDVATGVIIGKKKTVLKSKKLAAPALAASVASVLPGFP
jgi:hypothetical protein